MLLGERGEREDVGGGIGEVGGGVGELLGELLDDTAMLGSHRRRVGLSEDHAHEGGHDGLGSLGDLGEQVAHVVGAASLPARSVVLAVVSDIRLGAALGAEVDWGQTRITAHDASDGALMWIYHGDVQHAAFSPDGRYLAVANTTSPSFVIERSGQSWLVRPHFS